MSNCDCGAGLYAGWELAFPLLTVNIDEVMYKN